jgi:hypothetical protein
MDLFGIDIVTLVGAIVIIAAAAFAIATVIGATFIAYFWKTRKIVLPRVTLFLLNFVEAPIKNVMWLLGVEDDVIFLLRSAVVRRLYLPAFQETPVAERAIFLPQCLRNKDCPAPTNEEGIQCKGCGQCEIKKLKADAQALGYTQFFIAPGGTLVKRMIRKYHPKALIGVGCKNEVQMGTELAIRHGIAPIAIPLQKDGCVSTLVDWDDVRYVMSLMPNNVNTK